jgi:hypothetical protein
MRRLTSSAIAATLLSIGATCAIGQSADSALAAPDPEDFNALPPADTPIVEPAHPAVSGKQHVEGGIHWASLLGHEFLFLSFEHAFRVTEQEKTRDNIGGPFFKDWFYIADHVQWNRWSDGDKWFTSNLAHPAQGDVVAWIYRYNDDSAAGLELDFHDPRYRKMLMKAWVVAAVYSAQWKLGPLSEATIGHVGLHTDLSSGTNRTGLNDYVLDSFGGIPLMILEDAADKYAVRKLERHIGNRFVIDTIRVVIDPPRGIANVMMFKKPWHRDRRD